VLPRDVPVPTLMVLLGVGKQDHDADRDHNASGYKMLHHALQSKLSGYHY